MTTVERDDLERAVLTAEAHQYETLKREHFLSPEEAAAQVNLDRAPDMDPMCAMKAHLRLREAAIYDAATTPEAARAALVRDRQDRWSGWMANMADGEGVLERLGYWAAAMARRHGDHDTCYVHGIEMPWLMALLVVQYGESEHFWPVSWRTQDMVRAELWMSGAKPVPNAKGFVALSMEG